MQQDLATQPTQFDIIKQRSMENLHIFLWLIKDACWAMFWKPGGIIMVFPTLSVAFYILWRSRSDQSEFIHNLAVCFWICANSVWMLTEFMGVEKLYKKYAIYLFVSGIILLLVYYAYLALKTRKKQAVA